MLLPDKMTELAIHLAEGGKTREAMILVRKLLDRLTRDTERTDAYTIWKFDQIVEQLTSTLAVYGELPALTLLCEALLASLGETAHVDDAEYDESYVWRPAIEEHNQNAPKGFRASRNALVSAVRDVAEQLIRDGKATPFQVVDILEQFRAPIFARLAMHLLRLFPNQAKEAAARYLTTRDYFDKLCYHHEYALLSGVGFKLLTPEEQQTILGWIAPTTDWEPSIPLKDQAAIEGAKVAAEDDLDSWRLQRLTPFAHDLPPMWKARYDELVQRYGVPEHPDFVMYFTAGWIDNTAGAVTAEQLRAMTVPQLIEYLKTWAPSESWRGPSREGVGQRLAEAISADPEPFARDAERFADLHPVYLAAVFQGFERALSRKATFPWDAILQSAKRCLAGPARKEETAKPDTSENDESANHNAQGTSAENMSSDVGDSSAETSEPGFASSMGRRATREISSFAWVRSTIAHLLERALAAHPVPIARELQSAVWGCWPR